MLDKIKEKLLEVSDVVFYGQADEIAPNVLWNYVVFWRGRTRRNEHNTAFTHGYKVAIVNEEWVPEELIDSVIEKMESLPGMCLSSEDITFEYTRKPSTNAVLEIAIVSFSRARKKALAHV